MEGECGGGSIADPRMKGESVTVHDGDVLLDTRDCGDAVASELDECG